jgi:hypothetical protein
VRRRDFITLVGGTVAAWPLAARAQQAQKPVVAFIQGGMGDAIAGRVALFRRGLSEAETARVHHAARRWGSVAVRGACAATRADAAHRGADGLWRERRGSRAWVRGGD